MNSDPSPNLSRKRETAESREDDGSRRRRRTHTLAATEAGEGTFQKKPDAIVGDRPHLRPIEFRSSFDLLSFCSSDAPTANPLPSFSTLASKYSQCTEHMKRRRDHTKTKKTKAPRNRRRQRSDRRAATNQSMMYSCIRMHLCGRSLPPRYFRFVPFLSRTSCCQDRYLLPLWSEHCIPNVAFVCLGADVTERTQSTERMDAPSAVCVDAQGPPLERRHPVDEQTSSKEHGTFSETLSSRSQ